MSKQNLKLNLKLSQRLAILGRMRMAEWIEMPEGQFSSEVAKVESDPLFQKLFLGSGKIPGVIRRQRWPAGRVSSSYFELNEQITPSKGSSGAIDKMLDDKKSLIELIQRIGQKDFERYFLYPTEALSLGEIAKRTQIGEAEIKKVHNLLTEIDVHAEFNKPGKDPSMSQHYSCLGRIGIDEKNPYIEFNSSYWGRGLYQIRYEQLSTWKRGDLLTPDERKRIRHLVKRLETLNLRQNTIYRVLESLARLQLDYLKSRRENWLRPISLRLLAQRLQLAPSTISRVIHARSIRLPWGPEVPLATLLPGQRNTLKAILKEWQEQQITGSDSQLAKKLKQERGISVSRRTVNAVRHALQNNP